MALPITAQQVLWQSTAAHHGYKYKNDRISHIHTASQKFIGVFLGGRCPFLAQTCSNQHTKNQFDPFKCIVQVSK